MRAGICMSQVSKSRIRAALLIALLLPAVALAHPAAGAAVGSKNVGRGPPSQGSHAGKSTRPSRTPHVIYAHPLRVKKEQPAQVLTATARIAHRRPVRPGDIVVSTQGLNRFVFPAPVVKGPIFPADAPVLGTPVYLDDNRQVLIQFLPGSRRAFGMVVELAGHQVKSYVLAPRDVPAVTYHARGVRPPRKAWHATSGKGANGAHSAQVKLLRRVVMGEVPDSFYPTRLPPAAQFNKFDVVPRESWSDGGGHRILEYSLISVHGQAAVVAPPEFYRSGMEAILLSGDLVDAVHSPILYILEGPRRG